MNQELQVIAQWRMQARGGAPLLVAVAGNGLVARSALQGGADALLALSAGVFRQLGVGSLASFLPYANSNRLTRELLERELLPRAGTAPVIAGVLAHDPTIDLDRWLEDLAGMGVMGVTNWPAVGFADGLWRTALDQEGFGEAAELALMERARRHGLAAVGFVLDAPAAGRFAEAGCDALILDLGLTRAVDDVRERSDQLSRATSSLKAMQAAARQGGRDPLLIAFGGPITTAEDLQELMRHVATDGFAGGPAFERLPIEEAVSSTVRRFKAVTARMPVGEAADGMVGASRAMRELRRLIARIAPAEVNVCIEGESGVGKELVATALHQRSPRAAQPFITLNCGALPDSLIESELFGHERGAFTGADRRRLGKFELAHGGALFLDEVADLSPRAQVALLRAIQTREITRLGAERPVAVDVRILTASHQRLAQLVEEGRFRADLYFRLNHITIDVPSLRERLEDIPELVAQLMPRLSVQVGRPLSGCTADFLRRLASHRWSGNVRELILVITRAALLEDSDLLAGRGFSPELAQEARPDSGSDRRREAQEALEQAGGVKSRAASALGITRKTLYQWLKH